MENVGLEEVHRMTIVKNRRQTINVGAVFLLDQSLGKSDKAFRSPTTPLYKIPPALLRVFRAGISYIAISLVVCCCLKPQFSYFTFVNARMTMLPNTVTPTRRKILLVAIISVLGMPHVALAHPIGSITSLATSLRGRAGPGPGSYAIMTPGEKETVLYDVKYNAYHVFYKFGDGPDDRHKQYNTHNPTFTFKPSKTIEIRAGEKMEAKTLRELVVRSRIDKTCTVEEGVNSNDNEVEWYRIYLGSDKDTAMKSKSILRQLLSDYGNKDMNNPKIFDKYAADFVEEVGKRARREPPGENHACLTSKLGPKAEKLFKEKMKAQQEQQGKKLQVNPKDPPQSQPGKDPQSNPKPGNAPHPKSANSRPRQGDVQPKPGNTPPKPGNASQKNPGNAPDKKRSNVSQPKSGVRSQGVNY